MAYDAFISYSHAADDALAPAVQHALQTLARPWNRRRALEVFRDDTGLAVSPGLWTSICAGLDDSERFVLLASPEAAASSWVNQEIERWVESHSIDRLLPVLTAGEWIWDPNRGDFDWDRSTAVPPALRGRFREEPRHLDLRWARTETELDLRHSKFREAMAQLAAPMHNMSPQDLESSDVARFRHLVRLRRAVVAALCVLLLLVSVAGVIAVQQARQAQQQQAAAERQAKRALSLQLLAQGKVLANQQKTLGLLLTAEAARLTPAEAWGSVVSALDDTPGLAKIFDYPSGARAAATSGAVDVAADTYASATHQGQAPAIRLWDLSTGQRSGKPLMAARLYGLSATQLAYSPTGTLAAVYRCLKAVCAKTPSGIQPWDVVKRRPIGGLLPRSQGSSHLVFSHSGDRLAASTPDGVVHVWDVATRAIEATLRPPFHGTPTGLAFSADDTLLALSEKHADHILVWDADRRMPHAEPTDIPLRGGSRAEDVAFASGGVLVSRDDDGGVHLWRADSGRSAGELPTGTSVVSLAVAPDGTLATAEADGSLRLWNVERRAQIGSKKAIGSHGTGAEVMFNPDGSLVSTGSDIRLWDVSRWGQVGNELYHHNSPVTALAASSDGVVASGDERGVIRLWDLTSHQPFGQPLQGDRGAVTALTFSPEGILASGHEDGVIRLWDVDTGREVRGALVGPDATVTSVAFGSDGVSLAAAYGLGRDQVRRGAQPIQIWDVSAGSVIEKFDIGLEGGVASVDFGPGGLFASAGVDTLAKWDVRTWEYRILVDDPRAGPYTAVAFSPDGRTLASSAAGFASGDDRPVALWSMPSGDPLGEPLAAGPTQATDRSFRSLAFSPDGSLLAGAGDGGVQLWDVSSREPLGGRLGSSPASSVAVSPDGRTVIAGDADGAVVAYPATLDGWLQSLCSTVSRNLTREEWDSFVGSRTPYEATCPQYGAG